jgi:hypothetical protein
MLTSIVSLPSGDKIVSCHTRKKYEITELGIMHPEEVPTTSLQPGQVGYIACNMKQSSEGVYRFPCISVTNVGLASSKLILGIHYTELENLLIPCLAFNLLKLW